jgi:cytochrome c peroxidase
VLGAQGGEGPGSPEEIRHAMKRIICTVASFALAMGVSSCGETDNSGRGEATGMLSAASTQAAPVLTGIEQLRKAIFFDENLSLNQNQSCASCHGPEVGWTGSSSLVA